MTDEDGRLVDATGADEEQPPSLRPRRFAEFIGQKTVTESLMTGIRAARGRREVLDHVLLHGPPGLGKTTLARIIANELGVRFHQTSGPVIMRAGDLAAQLTNLDEGDVLFIDEIHRLNPAVEEVLYPAMEDFQLDLIIGEGPAARSVRIDLQRFTLVGATTRAGLITKPLYDRFLIPQRLDFYEADDLAVMLLRLAGVMNVALAADGAREMATRARGTPRVAGRLLRRVRDEAFEKVDVIDAAFARQALETLGVDGKGMDAMDRRYLACIADNYGGGPVGVETLAAALSEHRNAIEDVIEPFMMQQGFIRRTPSGRVLAAAGWRHLGLPVPADDAPDLFTDVPAHD